MKMATLFCFVGPLYCLAVVGLYRSFFAYRKWSITELMITLVEGTIPLAIVARMGPFGTPEQVSQNVNLVVGLLAAGVAWAFFCAYIGDQEANKRKLEGNTYRLLCQFIAWFAATTLGIIFFVVFWYRIVRT